MPYLSKRKRPLVPVGPSFTVKYPFVTNDKKGKTKQDHKTKQNNTQKQTNNNKQNNNHNHKQATKETTTTAKPDKDKKGTNQKTPKQNKKQTKQGVKSSQVKASSKHLQWQKYWRKNSRQANELDTRSRRAKELEHELQAS